MLYTIYYILNTTDYILAIYCTTEYKKAPVWAGPLGRLLEAHWCEPQTSAPVQLNADSFT